MHLESNKKEEKRMAFSVENLAKSSRTDNEDSVRNVKTPDFHKQIYHNVNVPYGNFQDNFSPCGQYVGRFMPSPVMASSPGDFKTQNDSLNNLSTPPSEDRKLKRKRCDSEETIPSGRMSADSLESVSPYASDSEGNISGDSTRRKKARTAFSTEQVNELETRYQNQKYLPASERSVLAEELGLSDQQVKTWFQNRRMKEKRQQRDEEQAKTFTLPTGGVDVSQLAALGIPCPPQPIKTSQMNQLSGTQPNPQLDIIHQQRHFPGYFDPRQQYQQPVPVGYHPMFPGFPMYPCMPPMIPQMHSNVTLSPMTRQAK